MAVSPIVAQLRQARRDRGLTQEAVAARAGVVRPTIGTCERGEHSPTLPILEAWAGALGLELRLVPVGEGELTAPGPGRPPVTGAMAAANRRSLAAALRST